MAARRFGADEVLEQIFDDEAGDLDSEQGEEEEDVNEEDSLEIEKEKLEKLIDSFDGGEGFNASLFRENARQALMPILCQSLAPVHASGNIEKGM